MHPVVVRAPLRISFVGGGTDFPAFYEQHGEGAVVSAAIDKHVYVCVGGDPGAVTLALSQHRPSGEILLGPLSDNTDDPLIREALRLVPVDGGCWIAWSSDVPSGTGLGSSSSLAVALLRALHQVRGEHVDPDVLAREASRLEIDLLGLPIGVQDHYAAAFGGVNLIRFSREGVSVRPLKIGAQLLDAVLMLRIAGTRASGSILAAQKSRIAENAERLRELSRSAILLAERLESAFDPALLGSAIHEGWLHKRELAPNVSTPMIDEAYALALQAGALGGKLCGAGSAGYLLLAVSPAGRARVQSQLPHLPSLQIGLSPSGSELLS